MGQRQSSVGASNVDNPLNPGVDSKPDPRFYEELKRLQTEAHRFADQSKPTVYTTLLNQIYNPSILIPKMINAIREGHLFDAKIGIRVAASAATVENKAVLGLFCPKEYNSLLNAALEPLLIYLGKVKRALSTESEKRTFSLDSLRYVDKINYTREDPEHKVSSSFLGEQLFNLVLTYLQFSEDSSGVRLAVTKKIREALWKQSNKHCFACDSKLKQQEWEAGHIRSVKHGGQTCLDNLRPLCHKCNGEMGAMNMLEYILRNDLSGKINLSKAQTELWTAVITLTDATSGDMAFKDLPYPERLHVIADRLTIPSATCQISS
jgi:hypothetical protein